MTSKGELEKKLDKVPARTPYELVASLREAHRDLHEAGRINEGVPYQITDLSGAGEAKSFAEMIQPTKLGRALQLLGDICRMVFAHGLPPGSDVVLKTGFEIYRDHVPPGKINHKY